MAKYIITLPNGTKQNSGDFKEVLDLMAKYIGQDGFVVEEIKTEKEKEKSELQADREKRDAFFSTLSLEQRADVAIGTRVVTKGVNGEYYIRFKQEQLPMHNSVQMSARNKKALLRSILKKAILDNVEKIIEAAEFRDEKHEFDWEDFMKAIKTITFIENQRS